MRFNTTPRGRVRLMAERCETCIFRPGNAMHLSSGRVREMVRDARANDSAIICHHTLNECEQAVCRGFYDLADDGPTAPLQIATRLDMLEIVETRA